MSTISEIEDSYTKDEIPKFNIGDTVDVHIKIKEGDRERIQIFTGTVIGRKGSKTRETFMVRRVVAGEGVERVFPLHSPVIDKIIVRRRGKVRRAKLYYLRERVGKAVKVKELIEDMSGKKKSRVKKRGRRAKSLKAAAANVEQKKLAETTSDENDVEEKVAASED